MSSLLPMFRAYRDRWQRDLMGIVRDELVRRFERGSSDPGEDEETFERMLEALWPPDGFDGRRKEMGDG